MRLKFLRINLQPLPIALVSPCTNTTQGCKHICPTDELSTLVEWFRLAAGALFSNRMDLGDPAAIIRKIQASD